MSVTTYLFTILQEFSPNYVGRHHDRWGKKMVGPVGDDPTTQSLGNSRSVQLSYDPNLKVRNWQCLHYSTHRLPKIYIIKYNVILGLSQYTRYMAGFEHELPHESIAITDQNHFSFGRPFGHPSMFQMNFNGISPISYTFEFVIEMVVLAGFEPAMPNTTSVGLEIRLSIHCHTALLKMPFPQENQNNWHS